MARDDRLEEALRLRRCGLSYLQIAETPWPDGPGGMLYGGDRHNARRAIVAARNDTIKEAADEVRQFEVDRLDMMLAGLAAKGLFDGDTKAVAAGLGIIATRAKLLGLNAPTEVHSTGGNIEVLFDPRLNITGMNDAELIIDESPQ